MILPPLRTAPACYWSERRPRWYNPSWLVVLIEHDGRWHQTRMHRAPDGTWHLSETGATQ